ncbi:MAG: hypothetical protein SVR04_08930, partial [Spirochaetota bacterium]|nr:hypothetical protein [Spirochaetota bacterium]
MALKKIPNQHYSAPHLVHAAALAAAFILSFTVAASLSAYPTDNDVIAAEFWTELDPAVDLEQGGVIS